MRVTSASTIALSLTTIMAATLISVTPLKAILEIWLPATNRAHDAAVQLLALVVGIAYALLVLWATGPVSRSVALETVIAVIMGLGGGSAAVGAHNIATTATRSRLPTPTPPTVIAPPDKGV